MQSINDRDRHNEEVMRMIEFIAIVAASDLKLEKISTVPDMRGGVTVSPFSKMVHRRNMDKLVHLARYCGLFK